MGSKVSPVIIIVIALVVVAMGIFVFSLMTSDKTEKPKEGTGVSDNFIKPMLDLSLNTPDENQEKVTITAKASMEDGSEILKIILPNEEEVSASEATYEVTENGNYEFQATAENGQTTQMSITVSNIRSVSYLNPYIPEGFSQVEGTSVDDGFTIEDTYGNQYVWVPVQSGQLTRDTLLDSSYEETSSTSSALVNSVAKNYGFYIGKYEASIFELNGEKVAASMKGKIPETNITFLDANELSNSAATKYGYTDCNTALINSYAWDTVLKLFDTKVSNYSTSTNYGNYSGAIYPTGGTEADIVYNICDIAGNVREWTTEVYKDATTTNQNNKEEKVLARVVRGGGANIKRTPKGHNGNPENMIDAYWGFRLILYK